MTAIVTVVVTIVETLAARTGLAVIASCRSAWW